MIILYVLNFFKYLNFSTLFESHLTMLKKDEMIDSQRFIEEARIMSKFHHDHIIQLVGVCTERKPIYIVMELCELGSMREYLQKHESLFENDQLQLIKERLFFITFRVFSMT